MHYELYIDVFFLINFMMDYLLLMLLKKMLSARAGRLQLVLGAFMGAVLTCLVVLLPACAVVKLILYHGVIGALMLETGLSLPFGKPLLRGWIFLYIGGVLMGGVMQLFHPYLREGSLLFALALLGYFFSKGIWALLGALSRRRQTDFEVCLSVQGKSCRLHALYDTGNHLKEGQSKTPVNIAHPRVLKRLGVSLEDLGQTEKIYRIPYRSIGENEGLIPAFCAGWLQLEYQGRNIVIKKPLIAVCDEKTGLMDYDLILNPGMLEDTDGAS